MALSTFLDAAITQVKRTRPSIDAFPPGSVRASLFDGAAGVAFFLHEVARLTRHPVMELAGQWLDVAEDWARRATKDDWEPDGTGGAWGHVHGMGGVAYARILVSSALGDSSGLGRGVEILAKACVEVREQRRSISLFEGAAGLLCVLGQVRPCVGQDLEHDIARLGEALWPFLAENLSAPTAQRGVSLGMAHGVAGAVFSAATWGGEAGQLHSVVRAKAAELVHVAERDESAILWPSMLGQPFGYLANSFCNGMTGHAYLWSLLARRGELAERETAQVVANTMCLLGPASETHGLCCGLAGQAVAHAALAKVVPTGSKSFHRRRARARLARAVALSRAELETPRRLHFWRGPLGVATVALTHQAGEWQMPCLERPAHA